MKRFLGILIVLAVLLNCFFCGCGSKEKADAQSKDTNAGTITVVDHAGNKVKVPKDIKRIAVCEIYPLPSVLSVFFDSANKIVAMSPASMSSARNGLLSKLYPEILSTNTTAMGDNNLNIEELMKLDPQVVFYNAAKKDTGDTLRKAGFNAVGISVNKWNYNCVETLNQWISLLSQIFPEAANGRAEKVKKYSEDTLNLIKERTGKLSDQQRKNVFFLFQYSEESIVTSGCHFFGQWWADSIGAKNVAKDLQDDNSIKVNLEQVYSWNPEIIFMTNFTTSFPEDLYENTVGNYDWSGITAVQKKQVYKMPHGMYRCYTPGVDTPVTLLWMAKTVYPDLFGDIDLGQKTKEYYKSIFGVDLTDSQANSIFNPSVAVGRVHI